MPPSQDSSVAWYDVSSRGYLLRAKRQIAAGTPEALFYAAQELRSGVTARLQEYAHAHLEILRQKKVGWEIPRLARNLEQAFKTGQHVVRLSILTRPALSSIYFTPVTRQLQSAAGQLGELLHPVIYRSAEHPWWLQKWALLRRTYDQLEKANRGQLLGPPLLSRSTGKLSIRVAFAMKREQEAHKRMWDPVHLDAQIAAKVVEQLEVKYLDEVPDDDLRRSDRDETP
jgi:hypothetical protein